MRVFSCFIPALLLLIISCNQTDLSDFDCRISDMVVLDKSCLTDSTYQITFTFKMEESLENTFEFYSSTFSNYTTAYMGDRTINKLPYTLGMLPLKDGEAEIIEIRVKGNTSCSGSALYTEPTNCR